MLLTRTYNTESPMQEAHTTGGGGIPRVELPQKLGVVVPPGQDSGPVWKMLVASGLSTDEGAARAPVLVDAGADGIEALPAWLEQHPEGHILLLFNAPVPTIARHMSDAVEPGEAVAQWRQHAEQVLAVVRPNRRRMTLVALEAALADPAAFTDLLGDRFGLALKRPVDTSDAGDDPGALFRMMAENAVWQSPDVRNLAAELEANALPMPPSQACCCRRWNRSTANSTPWSSKRGRAQRNWKKKTNCCCSNCTRCRKSWRATFQKNRDLSAKLDALEKDNSASAQSSDQLTELQTEIDQVKRNRTNDARTWKKKTNSSCSSSTMSRRNWSRTISTAWTLGTNSKKRARPSRRCTTACRGRSPGRCALCSTCSPATAARPAKHIRDRIRP